MHEREGRLVPAALAVFLLTLAVYSVLNSQCSVISDASTYLRFASSLAGGEYFIDYPPDGVFQEHAGGTEVYRASYTHLIREGKGISFVAAGYPLLLAACIAVGGRYAPFFANTVVFLVFFTLLYLLTTKIFQRYRGHREIALLTVLLYFLVNREHVTMLLGIYRDPLSYTFLLASVLFMLHYLRGSGKTWHLAMAGLGLGLATAVRETSFLAALPLALFYLRKYVADRSLGLAKPIVVCVLFGTLGVAPLLAQNYLNSGNPLYPSHLILSQVKRGVVKDIAAGDDYTYEMSGLKVRNMKATLPKQYSDLKEKYGFVLAALFFMGVWFGRKSMVVKFFLVPFIVVYIGFYSMYYSSPWRYLFVIHMMVIPLIAFAMVRTAHLAGELMKARTLSFQTSSGLVAAIFLYALWVMITSRPEGLFQVSQAERLRRDAEQFLPPESVVIAERPMRRVLDYFTHAYSVRPADFVRPERGMTLRGGVRYFLDRFGAVYFFDSYDRDWRHFYDESPVTRARVEEYFNLNPVGRLSAGKYRLTEYFGKEEGTLFQVQGWQASPGEQHVSLEGPAGRDTVLRVDAGKLWDESWERGKAELHVNGRLVDDAPGDGVNYYPLPAELIGQSGTAVVRMDSDAPLPRDLHPVLYDLEQGVVIDLGPEAVPFDRNFLSEEFFRIPSERLGRRLTGEGRVRLPLYPKEGTTTLVSAKVVLVSKAASRRGHQVSFQLNEDRDVSFTVPGANRWWTFCFPVPGAPEDAGEGEFTIRTGIPYGEVPGKALPDPYLAVDQVAMYRYDHRGDLPDVDIGTGDGFVVHSGFYEPELHMKKHSVRWSRGEGRLNLPIPRRAVGLPLRLELKVWGAHRRVPPLQGWVMLNGGKVGGFTVEPEKSQTLSFLIPAGTAVEGINDLRIENDTWRPSDHLPSTDQRHLGILLDGLKVTVTEPSP